jgi:hypothetical protein
MNFDLIKTYLLEDPDFINQLKELLKEKEQIEKPKKEKSNLYSTYPVTGVVSTIPFLEMEEAIEKVKQDCINDFYNIQPLTDLANKYKVSNRYYINFYLCVLAHLDLLWEPQEFDEYEMGLYKINSIFKYNSQRKRLFYLRIPKLKEENDQE